MDAFWIILTGSLAAVSCSLLGCFLVLRRMAMVGDAISHAVLPGIVIVFLLTGQRSSFPMLIGAGITGLLTTFLIEFFHKKAKLQTDASIGVTFTWLFAAGVILISVFAADTDLDLECVLYGDIIFTPLDILETADGFSLGPRSSWILGGTALAVIAFITIGYKGLFITTFDPVFAASAGISAVLWHYLLMGFVSVTTVASFESVGAILVIALMIVPPAAARLLTDNLVKMLIISCVLGIICAAGGYYLAVYLDGSVSGAMAATAGLEFAGVLIYSKLKKSKPSSTEINPVSPNISV